VKHPGDARIDPLGGQGSLAQDGVVWRQAGRGLEKDLAGCFGRAGWTGRSWKAGIDLHAGSEGDGGGGFRVRHVWGLWMQSVSRETFLGRNDGLCFT
jgi:hypothetical protein